MSRLRPPLQVATILTLLVGITLLDEATGLFHLTVLYAIPIILATAAFGMAGGLVTVGLAIVAVAVTHSLLHSPTVLVDVMTDLAVFLFAAFSVDRLRSQLRTIRELESLRNFDLGIARDVQRRMLRVVPEDARFETACILDFAREVGGDYYRFHEFDGRLAVLAGDISGKGVAAALFATLLDEALSDALRDCGRLADIAGAVNRRLHDSLPQDMFVTMLFAALDESGIEYINAGHVRPLLYASVSGEVTELALAGTTPLGVRRELDAIPDYVSTSAGDVLLICSDGVTESPALMHRPEALVTAFENAATQGPNPVVDRLRTLSESEGQTDDVTIICVRWR